MSPLFVILSEAKNLIRSFGTACLRMTVIAVVIFSFKITSYAELDLGFAQEDGGQPGAFLDFAADARSLGMGRAHVAMTEDAGAVYWNPAGLSNVYRKDIVVLYSDLYEDTDFSYLSFAQPTIDMGTFGMGVVSLRSEDFEKRDGTGQRLGSFNDSQSAFLLSHGIRFADRWSVGSTVKFVRHAIDSFDDTGYGFDGGLMFSVTPKLQTGLVAKNLLAPKIQLKKSSEKYPRELRMGLSYRFSPFFTLAADLNQTEDRSLKPHIGTEIQLNHILALRAGFNETDLNAGFGFKFGDWGVDYAFAFHDAAAGVEDLGQSHRFGLHINFGRRIQDQEASSRWHRRGQAVLEALRNKMDEPSPFENDTRRHLVETKLVIRHQGFLKPQDLYAAQGYISYFEKEYERSVQVLGEALVLDPNDTRLQAHLALARDQMTEERTREIVSTEMKKVRELYDKNDFRGTVKSCEKILSFKPDHAEAQTYLEDANNRLNEPILREQKVAKLHFERQEYLESIKGFQKVMHLDPENQEAARYMVHAIAALEKQAMTQESTLEGENRPIFEIERNPQKSREYYSQGLLLYSKGQIKEAASAWEQAAKLDGENALAKNAYNRAISEMKEAR